jgi:hypothetical protein
MADPKKVEFYDDYPEDEVTLAQFEELAKIRLKSSLRRETPKENERNIFILTSQ